MVTAGHVATVAMGAVLVVFFYILFFGHVFWLIGELVLEKTKDSPPYVKNVFSVIFYPIWRQKHGT